MTQINTNVPSMLAQRVLRAQNKSMVVALERLSTGLRINRGADDPAGLIASENLRSEKAAISGAISNAERAEQVVNVAEGGLQEIAKLMVELQSLVSESANEAGISAEEKDANQLQIDSILQTIDRLANATTFNGIKLLNGNFDYTTVGIDDTVLTDVTINSAKLVDGATMIVTATTLTSGQTAEVYLSTTAIYEAGGGGALTIEVTGLDGVQQFTFASGTEQADIIIAINSFKDALGVSAAVSRGAAGGSSDTNRVELRSTGFGTTNFVRVKQLDGPAGLDFVYSSALAGPTTAFSDLKDYGRDAAMIINGIQATANGLRARVSADGFDVTITIDGDNPAGINRDGEVSNFTITGGGADFSLSPEVNLAGKVSLGIETVTTGNLGNSTVGFLSAIKAGGTANVVNGNLATAQKVVDEAIKQVSSLRGRLGAFQKNTIGATISSLGVSLENTAAAESSIRDTDFARETASLTRQQILSQAATQVLAIANAQPQAVLALLG